MTININKVKSNLPRNLKKDIEIVDNKIILHCTKCSQCECAEPIKIEYVSQKLFHPKINFAKFNKDFKKFVNQFPDLFIRCSVGEENSLNEDGGLYFWEKDESRLIKFRRRFRKTLRELSMKDNLCEEEQNQKNKIEEDLEVIQRRIEIEQNKERNHHIGHKMPVVFCERKNTEDIQEIIQAIFKSGGV